MATESERLARIETKLDALVRYVEGNGQPGLLQRVSALEMWRSMLLGAWALFVIVAGAAFSSIKEYLSQPHSAK